MTTYTVEAEGNIPFASTQTAEITLPEFGRYIIVPEFKGMESPRGRTYATVVCSDIAAGAFGHTDGCTATVVDFLSGASLEGATLTLYPWRRNSAPTVMKGTTDADGFLSFASDLHGNIGASKGGDRFGTRFSVYPSECAIHPQHIRLNSRQLSLFIAPVIWSISQLYSL